MICDTMTVAGAMELWTTLTVVQAPVWQPVGWSIRRSQCTARHGPVARGHSERVHSLAVPLSTSFDHCSKDTPSKRSRRGSAGEVKGSHHGSCPAAESTTH